MFLGDSSAVSSWSLVNNWTLTFLLVIFSFFTTIYLLNLFISLLGDAINQTYNEESFLQLRGEILAEIELFWMLPHQRRKKNWFPEILYYKASVHELKKYIKNLKDENEDENLQNLLSEIKEIVEFKDDFKKFTSCNQKIIENNDSTEDSSKDSTKDSNEDSAKDSTEDSTEDLTKPSTKHSTKHSTKDLTKDSTKESDKDWPYSLITQE